MPKRIPNHLVADYIAKAERLSSRIQTAHALRWAFLKHSESLSGTKTWCKWWLAHDDWFITTPQYKTANTLPFDWKETTIEPETQALIDSFANVQKEETP